NHIHHKFLSMGFSTRRTMVLLILLSCGFSLGNILLIPYINNTALLVGNVGVWIGLNIWWTSN
ncbi:putative undecaprenyl-phosphate N-acetylglucosaminyl 1-phosphate transferase, partial [termite gut metagenome]